MNPQGSQPVNAAYFQSLTDQVNNTDTCADLQAFTAEAFASVNAMIKGIEDQLAALGPLLDLLTAPSLNLGAIVSWITSFIESFLTPLTKPHSTYLAQLTELVAQMSALASAVAAKAASFEQCAVVVPPVVTTP
ncbi:hypothetical protein [Pseudomonas fluorescens group sp. PF-69]